MTEFKSVHCALTRKIAHCSTAQKVNKTIEYSPEQEPPSWTHRRTASFAAEQ